MALISWENPRAEVGERVFSFKLNTDGDFVFDSRKRLETVTGDELIMQTIYLEMKTNLGEWFLNPDKGFDQFEVLGQKFDEERITDAVYAALYNLDRVDTVEAVELVQEGRKLKIYFSITKDDGEELNGEVWY